MNLTEKIKTLPQLPGVYRFLNKDNEIIYIGKSKNLRDRVRSYFTGSKIGKIVRLVHQIDDLEIEVCDTHLEARLLECQRIKEIRPPYNSQFKRERQFVYLKIGQRAGQAALSITTDPMQGLGPFRNRQLLEAVLAEFPKLYPLRFDFSDKSPEKEEVSETRLDFAYSLLPRRLLASEFDDNREVLERLFLEDGHWSIFFGGLEQAMLEAAEKEMFQQAIFFRDFSEHLKLLHRLWFEDKRFFDQVLFLRIPLEKGVKYFRIHNGCIEDQAYGTDDLASDFDSFCRTSHNRLSSPWSSFSERARFDFRDILYSEIRSLPPDQVVLEIDL